MANDFKLFMVLIGCKPPGRHTEQHDVFFGIAHSMADMLPQVNAFWPEMAGRIHVDAWREVTQVDGYSISVKPKGDSPVTGDGKKLFFINLGGYQEAKFEEQH